MSRKCKHITVSVSQEQYYRVRLLAAEYDTTVTSLVATLLEAMPALLRRMNYPKPKLETPSPLPTTPGTSYPTPGMSTATPTPPAVSPQPPTPATSHSRSLAPLLPRSLAP